MSKAIQAVRQYWENGAITCDHANMCQTVRIYRGSPSVQIQEGVKATNRETVSCSRFQRLGSPYPPEPEHRYSTRPADQRRFFILAC